MNKNMANFQMKIEEMQRKINIINDDIEEIKNGRKTFFEPKVIKINKNNTFSRNIYNKRKNILRDKFNNNNNNDFFNQRSKNNSMNFLNINNTGRTINHLNNTNFNLTNINIEEIQKNNYYINNTINSSNTNNDDISSRKELIINYKDKYLYKKLYERQENNQTINAINIKEKNYFNDNNNFENNIKNINSKTIENNDYFKNNIYKDYSYKKKNLNDINMNNSNDISNSHTINKIQKKKTYNNTLKEINSFSSNKKFKKIKKILINNYHKTESCTNKNLLNEVVKMKFHKKFKNNNIYNNINQKTIDINDNYSYNNRNIFNDNDIKKINVKSNAPLKIKTRNININIPNSKQDYSLKKDRDNTSEDIIIRNPKIKKIKNILNNDYYTSDKISKIKEMKNFHDISFSELDLENHFPNTVKNNKNHNFNNFFNNSIKCSINNSTFEKKFKYEQMLMDIIDVTNQYINMEKKINMNNILDEYKSLLYDIKLKNEFIYKIINLYNNSTNSNLNFNDSKSLISAWNWIKNNQNILDNNLRKENENKQYKDLCKNIMKEYNLKNIQQLKIFIRKLCKKVGKNENFLEGIKKILLP